MTTEKLLRQHRLALFADDVTMGKLRNRCDDLYLRCWDLEKQLGQVRGEAGYYRQKVQQLEAENAELRRKGLTYAPGFVDA